MTPRGISVAALAVGSGVVVVARRLQQRAARAGGGAPAARSRWRAVTIDRAPDDVMPGGRRPAPLAELGDLIDVEVRPAPGDKGTELRARLRTPEPSGAASAAARVTGDDPRQRVRAALRQAKQMIEAGEVLRVDPTPHGRRKASPAGAIVEAATRRAAGEGVL